MFCVCVCVSKRTACQEKELSGRKFTVTLGIKNIIHSSVHPQFAYISIMYHEL